jgi:xylulokinase
MSDYFIGIDSGTQGTKAVLIHGGNGKILAQASAKHELIPNLPAGAMEQHPDSWVAALEKTVKEVVKLARVKPAEIKAIGVSGQQHGFVALDAEDKVIRPAKLWCDTSTASQAEALVKKLGGLSRVIELTGNGIPAGFTASKIAWMKAVEPKNYARLATVLLPHDYLNFYLTGVKAMEAGDASGTGFFNTKTRQWDPTVVEAIDPGLMSKLPPVLSAESPVGTLRPLVAKRLGLSPETMVSCGGGDNMMGAIGTGNTKIGVVTASLGTSGTIYAYSSRPIIDPKGEIAAFCDSTGGWLPLVCTMNVTVATELVKGVFRWDNEKLTKQAASIRPGSDGVIMLPYFNGERCPNLPDGKAVIFGLGPSTFTPAHLARAAMEGVTYGLNYGLGRLQDLGVRPKQIRVTGGGSKNPLWRQILADIFDTEVVGLQTAEGASYGAALQAKWCHAVSRGERVRIAQISDQFVKVDSSTAARPRKAEAKLYRPFQLFFNEMSRASAPLFEVHRTLPT